MAKIVIPGWLRNAGFAMLALGLLVYAFEGVDLHEVWKYAKHAKWIYILASVLLGYLALLSRSKRWTLVLKHLGYPLSTWTAAHSISIGYLINMAVPRAGEVARATALYRANKTPINVLLGTIIMERTIDLVILVALIGLTFLSASEELHLLLEYTQTTDSSDSTAGMAWGTILTVILVFVLLAVILFWKKMKASDQFLRVRAFSKGLMDGIKAVAQLPNPFAFWAHTVLIWLCYYAMVYICFFSLPYTLDTSLSEGLFVMIAASLGIIIPVPGGVGAYHYLVTMALVVLGLSKVEGLAFATLVHAAQSLMLIVAGVIGIIGLSVLRKTRKPHGQD